MKTKGVVEVEIEIMRLPTANNNDPPLPKPKAKKKISPPKIPSKPNPKIKRSKWYQPPGIYNLWGAKRNPTGFGLQIGSFTIENEAKEAGLEALEFGLEVIYVQAAIANKQPIYRVMVDSYKTRAAAEAALPKIKRRGFSKAFIRKY